jgi:hypothetical protein
MKSKISVLAVFLLCLLARAQFSDTAYIAIDFESSYQFDSTPNDTLYRVFLGGGTLELKGYHDKENEFPADLGTRFDHVELSDTLVAGSTVKFIDCALLPSPSPEPETKKFFELPLDDFDNLRLEFENSWLYGGGSGVRLNTGHRGGLKAMDSWFTLSDTAIVSTDNVDTTWFENCRFAWGDTGLAFNNGRLRMRNCDFVSLDLGIAIAGKASLEAENCLFQSDRTMLAFSDSAEVHMDSCAFYEVQNYCMEGRTDTTLMNLSILNTYFDSMTVLPAKRIFNLPDDIVDDSSQQSSRSGNEPIDIVIHVDDSSPLYDADSLRLSADLFFKASNGLPMEARFIHLYSLPADQHNPESFERFQTDSAFRSNFALRSFDLEEVENLPRFPQSDSIRVDLGPVAPLEGRSLFIGTADDGFPTENPE